MLSIKSATAVASGTGPARDHDGGIGHGIEPCKRLEPDPDDGEAADEHASVEQPVQADVVPGEEEHGENHDDPDPKAEPVQTNPNP